MKKEKNRLLRIGIFLVFLLSFAIGQEAMAATFTPAQSGNWSSASTWDQGSVPTATDDVDIDAAVTVTVDQDVTIDDITISAAGTITAPSTGSFTITTTGNLSFTAAGFFEGINGVGTLDIVFDNTASKTITIQGANDIDFNNMTVTTGSVLITAGDLSMDIHGNLTLEGTASFDYDATYAAGNNIIFQGNNKVITVDDAATLAVNNMTVNGSGLTTASNMEISGNLTIAASATFVASASKVTFTNETGGALVGPVNNAANPVSSLTFYDVDFDGTANDITPGATGNFTVSGDFTLVAGNFTPTAGEIVFNNQGTLNNPKTIVETAGALTFFNLKVEDGSYVTSVAAIEIDGTGGAGNGLSVLGSGYLAFATPSVVTFDGATPDISVSTAGTLKFYDLTLGNTVTGGTTSSDFTIIGDLTAGTGLFTASSPSTITFEEDAAQTHIDGLVADLIFNNLVFADNSDVVTANNHTFQVNGSITVEGDGSFVPAATSVITIDGGNTKSITNSGTLTLQGLTLANTAGNTVNLNSDMTIAATLTIAGANASLVAGNNSTLIIDNAAADINNAAGAVANLVVQNIQFTNAAAALTSGDMTIKGDLVLVSDAIVYDPADVVKFAGTSLQKIRRTGTGSVTFGLVTLDNLAGLRQEMDVAIAGTGVTVLTLTSGDWDLYGNNDLDLTGADPDISETVTTSVNYTVINSLNGTGYVEVGPVSAAIVGGSGIGFSGLTVAANDLVVRRYHRPKQIGENMSIDRYYELAGTFVGGVDNDPTFDFEEVELNGNTGANLAIFTTDADNNPSAITGNVATGWDQLSVDTYTAATPSVALTATNVITGQFYAFVDKTAQIDEWPDSLISTTYDLAPTTLVASMQNQVLMRFKINATADITFTGLNINLNRNVTGILENFELWIDPDGDLANAGDAAALAGQSVNVTSSQLQFTGFTANNTITAGTAEYFYVIADVSSSVTSASPQIYFTLTENDITIANCNVDANTITSQNYGFGQSILDISTSNSPEAGYLVQNLTNQEIFGFNLNPTDDAVAANLNSARLKFTIGNGALSTDFYDFKITIDANKNGVVEATENAAALQTIAVLPTNGYITFSGAPLTALNTDETTNFLIYASVPDTAVAGGTIEGQIESYNDITVDSPVIVSDDGPYSGNQFTVVDQGSPAEEPTKLEVVGFALATLSDNKDGKNVITGSNIKILVEAQDANGYPRKIPTGQATNFSVTVSSGTATIANNTGTIAAGTTRDELATLTLTNADGYGPITLTVTPTSGMTALTPATYDLVQVYATQPTNQTSVLATTATTPTTLALSWTNGDGAGRIIVAKQGSWPADPQDGIVYNAATGNNFSTPAATNGTTGTGSVVVYKGTAGTSVTISGLEAGKTYYFKAFEYNGGTASTSLPNYKTTDDTPFSHNMYATTYSTEPTTVASGLTFSDVTATSMKLNWTNGNGEYRMVIAQTNATGITASPTDATTYTANSVFGTSQSQEGADYIVYIGNSNTFTVTNLVPDTDYDFEVFEFNGSGLGANYLTSSSLTGTRSTLAEEPTIQASNVTFDEITPGAGNNTSITLNWENGNGDRTIVVGKAGSAISSSEAPSDQTAEYTANTGGAFGTGQAVGDGYVVYYQDAAPSNTVTVTGLQYGQTYYFKAYSFNQGSGTNTTTANSTINYLTSDATSNPSGRIADSYENNETIADAKYMAADGSLVTGIISSESDQDYLFIEPDVLNGYNAIRIRLTSVPKNYTLEVYNSDGRLLRRSKRKSNADEILVINNVPVGTYYIKVYSESGEFSLTPYRVSALQSQTEYKSETP